MEMLDRAIYMSFDKAIAVEVFLTSSFPLDHSSPHRKQLVFSAGNREWNPSPAGLRVLCNPSSAPLRLTKLFLRNGTRTVHGLTAALLLSVSLTHSLAESGHELLPVWT